MPDFVRGFEYVTYIAATPEKVWQALTSPEISRKYFFGRSVEIDCRVGGQFVLRIEDGKVVDSQGKVVECDPPRKLSFTWKVEWLEEYRDLPEALVTFTIEPAGEVTRLTFTEGQSPKLDAKYKEAGKHGWPMVLSGLKTLLETGKALPITPPQPPKS
jgi:uncharacterized protein YndB with AHSA1/START domain